MPEAAAEGAEAPGAEPMQWFAMRDLGRKTPGADGRPLWAWQWVAERGHRVFVPLAERIVRCGGRERVEQVAAVAGLAFLRATRADADAISDSRLGLIHRYVKGAPYRTPTTVADAAMEAFIRACASALPRRYYTPGQIAGLPEGSRVRVASGPLAGVEGRLIKIRGSRSPRLLLSLPGLLDATFTLPPASSLLLTPLT